jgi:beta-phosphoglucomutase-like phosphatase (HAD superfamily)
MISSTMSTQSFLVSSSNHLHSSLQTCVKLMSHSFVILTFFANDRRVTADSDGTLVDTMPVHLKAWQHAAALHNLTFSAEQFYALAGVSAADIVVQLAAEQGVSPAPRAADVLRDKALCFGIDNGFSSVRPVAPALAVLKEARKRGLKIGVASGGQRDDVIESLVSAGLVGKGCKVDGEDGIFDAFVTAEDVTRGKPHPETFLMAAQRMSVEPKRCVGLEDAELGIQALVAAGMRAVDIRRHKDYPLSNEHRVILDRADSVAAVAAVEKIV